MAEDTPDASWAKIFRVAFQDFVDAGDCSWDRRSDQPDRRARCVEYFLREALPDVEPPGEPDAAVEVGLEWTLDVGSTEYTV